MKAYRKSYSKSMIIHIGSKNPTKIQAAENIIKSHELFPNATIKGMDANVEEFGHPKTLKETIKGAKDRAKAVFEGCNFSVGLESGMFTSEDAKSGYFETTACAIYDGKTYHLGLAPSFEWPREMVKLILAGKDGSQAFKEIGLTSEEKIGATQGGLYVLTHGKTNRTKMNELAIMMALIHLENPGHY